MTDYQAYWKAGSQEQEPHEERKEQNQNSQAGYHEIQCRQREAQIQATGIRPAAVRRQPGSRAVDGLENYLSNPETWKFLENHLGIDCAGLSLNLFKIIISVIDFKPLLRPRCISNRE